jgi:PAS domain S-box-containing protein
MAANNLETEVKKRKQENKALMESEEKSRYLFNLAPEPIAIIQNNRHVFINNKFTELFKYTMQDVDKGLSIADLVPGKDREIAVSRIKERLAGKKLEKEYAVVDVVAKNGKIFPCEVTGNIIEYEGQPADLVIIRDMTERKQAENALRESDGKYRALFENAGDALFYMEVGPENEPRIIECNQRTLSLFGCEPDDIIGKRPAYFSPEIQPDGKSSMKKATELTKAVMGGQSQDFQWLFHRHDNKELFWVEVNLTQLTLGGKSNYMQAIVRDITERKQAEDLVQDLSRQLIASQENERQMISYELHDSVAQDLSSSRITCEMLLKYKSLTPGARKQISEISGNLHKTLISVRDLSYDLRPPGLEKFGLPNVMYQFCEDFSEKTGIRVDFQSAGIDGLNLNYNTKINLYRCLQEGLNNVKKHADAGNVKVRLISSFPNVILRINDDGKGFDLKERLAKTSSEKKMGLSSMAHRVDLLLGRIDIESTPGKGTKILIEIPHQNKKIRA